MFRQGLKELKKNEKQGISLPFAACAGALLLAFALAIVYTAGLMLSNANHKLAEERCYQLAKSYAGVIDQELRASEQEDLAGTFRAFANKFLNGSEYIEYKRDQPETVYHYILQSEEDPQYGGIELRLRKEINEDKLSGLEGTLEPPTNSEGNYGQRIDELMKRTFQRYIFTVEVIAEQEGLTYNYATEYSRVDVYPVEFKYGETTIAWNSAEGKWKIGTPEGKDCNFDVPGQKITFTFNTKDPKSTTFVPVHEEGGAS